MAKIKVKTPVVEIDGDEMTRIIWHYIREQAGPSLPRRSTCDYYDLSASRYRDADRTTR